MTLIKAPSVGAFFIATAFPKIVILNTCLFHGISTIDIAPVIYLSPIKGNKSKITN